MNDKFHKIGIVTEDNLIDLIDYLNDEVCPMHLKQVLKMLLLQLFQITCMQDFLMERKQ